jgi:hypothetical protein
VLRTIDLRNTDATAWTRTAQAAIRVSSDVAGATTAGPLQGVALDHARGMVATALETIERLADGGWRTVAGDPQGMNRARRGRDVVAERTESFDPMAASLARRR